MTVTLKDPESVRFQDVRVRHLDCHGGPCHDDPNGQAIVCGRVNAKNGFGGYVGFEPFMFWNGHLFGPEVLKTLPLWKYCEPESLN